MHSLLTITLAFSLRFFPFVLERGKNPENPGWFLGVKIFRNVRNFQKTGIYVLNTESALKVQLQLWLEDMLRHNKPYRSNNGIPLRWRTHSLLTITGLAFCLSFFSFVLERGKNPENLGCFLGVKIFRLVRNFRKLASVRKAESFIKSEIYLWERSSVFSSSVISDSFFGVGGKVGVSLAFLGVFSPSFLFVCFIQ